jgi:hypothetical protein
MVRGTDGLYRTSSIENVTFLFFFCVLWCMCVFFVCVWERERDICRHQPESYRLLTTSTLQLKQEICESGTHSPLWQLAKRNTFQKQVLWSLYRRYGIKRRELHCTLIPTFMEAQWNLTDSDFTTSGYFGQLFFPRTTTLKVTML